MAVLCIAIYTICATSRSHHNANIKRHDRTFIYEFIKRTKSLLKMITTFILISTINQ